MSLARATRLVQLNSEIWNVDSLIHQSAAVASEVEHEPLHALGLERLHLFLDLIAYSVGKSGLEDVTCCVIEHSGIFNVREMDTLAHNRNVDDLSRTNLLHLEDHGGSRLSLHPVAAFLCLETLGRHAVDLDDFVTAHKAVFLGRRTRVRLVDYHILVLLLMDDRADTAVSLRQHHLQVLVLLLRDIDCIWIELLEHRIHARAHDPVHRKRVNV